MTFTRTMARTFTFTFTMTLTITITITITITFTLTFTLTAEFCSLVKIHKNQKQVHTSVQLSGDGELLVKGGMTYRKSKE